MVADGTTGSAPAVNVWDCAEGVESTPAQPRDRPRGHRVSKAGLWFFASALPAYIALPAAGPVVAQAPQAAGTAEASAAQFFQGLGRLEWSGIVDLLHTDVHDRFQLVADQLVGSLRGDSVLILLYGGISRGEYERQAPRETFLRSMMGLVTYARGLMESQVTTDVEILGTVAEGDSLRHVVYREGTDHMGTELVRVSVTTLRLQRGDWRILRNDELDVLETALRGLPIGRSPPPGPGGILAPDSEVEAGSTVPNPRGSPKL